MDKQWACYHCFADDTLLAISASSRGELKTKVEKEVQHIEMNLCGLALNRKKIEVMILAKHPRTNDQPIEMNQNGCQIGTTRKFKYLGVIMDNQLLWYDHIEHVKR